ncbi:MAG: hypothetical protein ACJ77A_14430 [Actinomycetota bacterium]
MALSERDRRALIIFGAVIAVALLAYFLFLKPKGETPIAVGPSVGVTTPPPTAAPTTSAPVTPRTPPPSGFLVGKDPFSPLVNPSGGGTAPSSTSTSFPTSTGTIPFTTPPFFTTPPTTFPTTPFTTPPTTPFVSPPASPTGGNGGTSTHVGGHTVTLIAIFRHNGSERAQVQVDSTGYVVSEGETFAVNYKLMSISGNCASFLNGSNQFTLCENPQK